MTMCKGQPPSPAVISPQGVAFLAALGSNNSKPWFEEHREEYRELIVAPLAGLAMRLAPALSAIDPLMLTDPAKAMSRIHRDVRFSKDKSPYRTTVWLAFKRPCKDWKDRPCFFFEFTPTSWRYGMGFYAAAKPTMDALRQAMDDEPDAFRAAIAFLSKSGAFTVEGESYQRVLNRATPEDILPWYQRKSFHLVRNRPVDATLFSPGLANVLREGFEEAAPLYRYLWSVLEAG